MYTSDPIEVKPGFKGSLNIPVPPAQSDENPENLRFDITNDSHRGFRVRIELDNTPELEPVSDFNCVWCGRPYGEHTDGHQSGIIPRVPCTMRKQFFKGRLTTHE